MSLLQTSSILQLYDLTSQAITYPGVGLRRKLHPSLTQSFINTPCGGGVLVFSAKKTTLYFICPFVKAVSMKFHGTLPAHWCNLRFCLSVRGENHCLPALHDYLDS